jgi:hypothetical protein
MIRAKLIAPTQVLLEHPLLSPVKECEFVLVGKQEMSRIELERLLDGALIGAAITAVVTIFILVFKWCW